MRIKRTTFKSGSGSGEIATLRGSGEGVTVVTIMPGAEGFTFSAADENDRPLPVVEESERAGPEEP